MSHHIALVSDFAEIMSGKSERRISQVMAVRMARPEDLERAASDIRKVMGKSHNERRQRIAPPAFAI